MILTIELPIYNDIFTSILFNDTNNSWITRYLQKKILHMWNHACFTTPTIFFLTILKLIVSWNRSTHKCKCTIVDRPLKLIPLHESFMMPIYFTICFVQSFLISILKSLKGNNSWWNSSNLFKVLYICQVDYWGFAVFHFSL